MSRCVPTIGWVLEVPTPVDVVTSEDATRGEKRGNLWMKTSLDCHWDLSLVLHIYKESMLQSASVAGGKRRRRDTASGVAMQSGSSHPPSNDGGGHREAEDNILECVYRP